MISAAHAGTPQPCSPQWNSGVGIPGVANVFDLAVFDDGTGPALYAGSGSSLGGLLLRWDGAPDGAWEVVKNAPINNDIRALHIFDDGTGPALFCAGEFFVAGEVIAPSIAKWDGAVWSPLGDGISGFGLAMTTFDAGDGAGDGLIVGGAFSHAGGEPANRIARWDGLAWSTLGSGMNGLVQALVTFDRLDNGPALYAGGNFSTAGGISAANIARWDGDAWSAVGSGLPSQVRALVVHDDGQGDGPALYAGGFVTEEGGFPFIVSRWTGSEWEQVGDGFNGTIRTLNVFDDGTGAGAALYVGGDFSTIVTPSGDIPTGRIARWDGTAWSPLQAGLNGSVGAMVAFDNAATPTLLVGGSFTTAAGAPAGSVAQWTGCAPSARPSPDLNQDGTVDGADLGILLAAWGRCGVACDADLNGDGVVDGADLGLLLAAWDG